VEVGGSGGGFEKGVVVDLKRRGERGDGDRSEETVVVMEEDEMVVFSFKILRESYVVDVSLLTEKLSVLQFRGSMCKFS